MELRDFWQALLIFQLADNEPIDRLKITPVFLEAAGIYQEDLGDKVYDKLFDTFA